LTGWAEAEDGAPSLEEGLEILRETVATFGPGNVIWRFSPVPLVAEVTERFGKIAEVASSIGIEKCYLSFLHPVYTDLGSIESERLPSSLGLQSNRLMPETWPPEERSALIKDLVSRSEGVGVYLCADDKDTPLSGTEAYRGVCENGERFSVLHQGRIPKEECGCALCVDPFTVGETCSMRCAYCYSQKS
jgi:hypothetical protein